MEQRDNNYPLEKNCSYFMLQQRLKELKAAMEIFFTTFQNFFDDEHYFFDEEGNRWFPGAEILLPDEIGKSDEARALDEPCCSNAPLRPTRGLLGDKPGDVPLTIPRGGAVYRRRGLLGDRPGDVPLSVPPSHSEKKYRKTKKLPVQKKRYLTEQEHIARRILEECIELVDKMDLSAPGDSATDSTNPKAENENEEQKDEHNDEEKQDYTFK